MLANLQEKPTLPGVIKVSPITNGNIRNDEISQHKNLITFTRIKTNMNDHDDKEALQRKQIDQEEAIGEVMP